MKFASINDPKSGYTYDINPVATEKANRIKRDVNVHPHEIRKRQVQDETYNDFKEMPVYESEESSQRYIE